MAENNALQELEAILQRNQDNDALLRALLVRAVILEKLLHRR